MKYPLAAACIFFGLSYASWHLTGSESKAEAKAVPKAMAKPTPESSEKKNS